MSSERIKEIEKTMQIYYTVFSITDGSNHSEMKLAFVEDFADEGSALLFVRDIIDHHSSLTIIKRYV